MTPISLALLLQLYLLGLLGFRWPRAAGLALGAQFAVLSVVWGGSAVLLFAIILLVGKRDPVASLIAVAVTMVAAKQEVVRSVFPDAAEVIPAFVVQGLAFAGGFAGTPPAGSRDARYLAWGTLAAALLNTMPLLPFFWEGPVEKVARARRYDMAELLYPSLLRDAEALASVGDKAGCFRVLAELVAAVPRRDEAAIGLGIERAWSLGWYPVSGVGTTMVRCDPTRSQDRIPLRIATLLEDEARGGQAYRVLRAWPREGEVDWRMALLERSSGLPVRWKGGLPENNPHLPLSLGWPFSANGYFSADFLLDSPAAGLLLEGEGTPYQGPPTLEVVLDGEPPRLWTLDGPSRFRWEGPIPAGPHRISARFTGDLVGPTGDRNAQVDWLRAE